MLPFYLIAYQYQRHTHNFINECARINPGVNILRLLHFCSAFFCKIWLYCLGPLAPLCPTLVDIMVAEVIKALLGGKMRFSLFYSDSFYRNICSIEFQSCILQQCNASYPLGTWAPTAPFPHSVFDQPTKINNYNFEWGPIHQLANIIYLTRVFMTLLFL